MFFTAFVFICVFNLTTEGQTIYKKTSLQSYQTHFKLLTYPGLTLSIFEQPSPVALLLGLAKSI